MEKRWRPAAGIAVLCLALTACTSQPSNTPAKRIPPDPFTQRLDEQATANRKQAEDEARGLLERARIPPGAVALNLAPAQLRGLALGIPTSGTYITLARYWRVPMSFKAADDYVRQHPPAGLAQEGSSSESRQGMIRHGYAWDGQVLPSSRGGQLSIAVAGSVAAAAGGDVSYLRVIAGSPWLDPHPFKDSMKGPRLRLESGHGCPASEGPGIVGVRNDGADDLNGALAPNGAPTSGRVCVYAGRNGQASALLRERALPRAEAARVATAARSVEIAHSNGPWSCVESTGTAAVVVLTYPGRPAVNLWILTGGCPTASNGHLVAVPSSSMTALVDLLNQVAG